MLLRYHYSMNFEQTYSITSLLNYGLSCLINYKVLNVSELCMHGVFLDDLGTIMAANDVIIVLSCHYQRYVNVPVSIYFIAVVIAMPENHHYHQHI